EPIGCRFSSFRKISAGAWSTLSRTSGVRRTVPARRSRAAWMVSRETGNAGMSGLDLHFGLDLHAEAEGKGGNADGGAGMAAPLRAVQLDDEIGETVDHLRLAVELGRGVDHAEDPQPGGDAVEVAQLARDAAKQGERGRARRLVGLLDGAFRPSLSERPADRTIRTLRPVPRNVSPAAAHAHEGEGQFQAGWDLHRRGQD